MPLFVNKSLLSVPAYRSAKTGLNLAMREWTRLLKEDGVKTWCVSPGYFATGLGVGSEANKQAGEIDSSIGAEFVRSVVEGVRGERRRCQESYQEEQCPATVIEQF